MTKKSIINTLVEEYDWLSYTEFRIKYTKIEGIHRDKSFYHSKYGQYMNRWREMNGQNNCR